MNSISSWFCSNNSKNLFVKIVHPGGHVELHNRPILAKDLLNRNPKCCVAHPNVFQQPHAILSPETTLVLGQKYYVVPLGTIRKLQLKYPPLSVLRGNRLQKNDNDDDDTDTSSSSSCWLFRNNKNGGKEKSGIKIRGCNSESSIDKMKIRREEEDGRRDVKERPSSPGRLSLASMDNWHSGLESITEDY